MSGIAYLADRTFTPQGIEVGVAVVVEDGKIVAVTREIPEQTAVVELPGKTLIPGLIDIHIHGRQGADVMDASADALQTIAQALPQTGVVAWVGTTVSAPMADIFAALEQVRDFMADPVYAADPHAATLLGSFLEGPYFTAPFRGSHPEKYLTTPTVDELEQLLCSAGNTLLRAAVAPESPAAIAAVRWFVDHGIKTSVAHTAANFAQVTEAFEQGADCGVHLYNGMSGLHHRKPGCCGAVLYHDMLVELIADGIHVHPVMMNLAYRMKGYRHMALITDCMRAGGLGEGRYLLGAQYITVRQGEARTDDGSLAGSTCSLDQALRNMIQVAQVPEWEAVQMASAVPAAYLGMEAEWGAIQVGAHASMVVMNPDFTVAGTLLKGQWAYRNRHHGG
ncbi:N-acetylglucosamine-6-phosphate deacetylase [Yersinia ruckeri]|uniref:N-acetylglucosamine-6-phosphate deacetylase n=1 Tax=Yersinia ruckeri TaxID=29486 RepID=UPI000538163F|nr:N-acetylglucosamine-6-phosphate deacetylase [Yersinia ruckeri]AUQ41048.1 N-acetylglucosamine-6-phosphate deacetylase [Yersinia ruckeri]ELM3739301.1 N-acetylglucosamine-6-phosphate deacetylase [Yersinia ruckeri]MCK8540369.1 N-acetylglucosamine-6-phosphate deacetylase [Yersinia ruckeri]MCK8541381.1 N-acetylglucosamine-6-phosphate deacetylase [Yersinia ruckeri]MCK8551285.1 N-acetylglucosamine-6-phosphate deacetylase [Yersinia ruckeri]